MEKKQETKRRVTPQKILLIRTDRLGDLILSLPAIQSVIASYPQAEIDVVVNTAYAELMTFLQEINKKGINQKRVNRIYTCDPYHIKPLQIIKLISSIRQRTYDLAIDLLPGANHFSSLLLACARAKEKVGYAVGLRKYVLTKKMQPPKEIYYERDQVLDIVKEAGVGKRSKIFPFKILNEKKYAKENKEHLTIIIHPATASDWRRHWPKTYYQRLLNLLLENKKEKSLCIIFTGTEQEKKDIDEIIADISPMQKKQIIENRAGNTHIKELITLLSSADVILTPLTGVTHLAVALNKHVITLVGPTPITRWTTKELPYKIIKKDFSCSPCEHKSGCIYGDDNRCMKAITPEEVYKEIMHMDQIQQLQ